MYYDEERYYEPSQADELLMEYQEKMKQALLDGVKQEIEKIKLENQNLREENTQLKYQVDKIDRRETELEYKKANLSRDVRRERLSQLMSDFQVILYKVASSKEELPKCDKCNDKRQIEYKSPLGKTMYEYCSCANGKLIYVPQSYVCYEFKIDRNGNSLDMWYKAVEEKDYTYLEYSSSEYKDKLYKHDMSFEQIDKYKTFFRSKEDCQRYCDWLTKNEHNM